MKSPSTACFGYIRNGNLIISTTPVCTAEIQIQKSYIGLAWTARIPERRYDISPASHVWRHKDEDTPYAIKWRLLEQSGFYST